MYLPLDAGGRFQKLMYAAWTLLNRSQSELMLRARINPTRRNTFWRACYNAGPKVELTEARRAIQSIVGDPPLDLPANVVWDWVIGKLTVTPAIIHELIISVGVQPIKLLGLVGILTRYEASAKTQIAYSAVPKISALTPDAVKVVHRNCTKLLGPAGTRVRSWLNEFYRLRQTALAEGGQGTARRTLLYFRSDLLQFRNGTGLLAGLSDDLRGEAIQHFAMDAIDRHGFEVGVIDDCSPHVPRDLIAGFRKFDGLFILDNTFLMKVHPGGLFRTTCENLDQTRKTYIEEQLRKLQQLKNCVTHGWTKSEMKNAFIGATVLTK